MKNRIIGHFNDAIKIVGNKTLGDKYGLVILQKKHLFNGPMIYRFLR